jgi:hypothetical protein
LELEDSHIAGEPGEPAFSVQQVQLALPAFSDVVKFEVEVTKKTVTSAPVFVVPVQKPRLAPLTVKSKQSYAQSARPPVTRPDILQTQGVTPPRMPLY